MKDVKWVSKLIMVLKLLLMILMKFSGMKNLLSGVRLLKK